MHINFPTIHSVLESLGDPNTAPPKALRVAVHAVIAIALESQRKLAEATRNEQALYIALAKRPVPVARPVKQKARK